MGLFGPSRKEIWEKLSAEIHAEYIEGGIWKGDKVQAHVDNWIVVLDTYTVSTGKSSITYTRMRAPFKNLEKLYFKIYREGLFSNLGKLFGMQDISVGYEKFDENFIIKSNNEIKIKQLFSYEKVRELIEAQPDISLEIKDDEGYFGDYFPKDADELYFLAPGVIKDIEQLKELFELFSEVLKELSNLGIASNEGVSVELS